MIADNIQKTKRDEGNLHDSSYFELQFTDGSLITEKDVNWSDVSEQKTVTLLGKNKLAYICKYPVDFIRVTHDGLVSEVDIPDDCEVYQAFKSEALFAGGVKISDLILGRIIGIVKDGIVIEERFLDGRGNQIIGFKL